MSPEPDKPARDINERLAKLGPAQRALLEARLLEKRTAEAAAARIPKRAVESPCPLSYSQELLWLLSELESSAVAYNAPAAFRLEGEIDPGALQTAFDAVVARHEVLRTRYDVIDGQPMQLIAPSGSVDLEYVDLSSLGDQEREAELHRILSEGSEHEFDLRFDAVLRPTLIRLADREHVLFTVMHHIATDGWSRGVIYDELTAFYEAALNGGQADLAPLTIQYADFAVWHREWLDGGVLERQLSYWKDVLAGAPSRLELPADHARPAVRTYHGDHQSRMLSVTLRDGLQALGREGDGTLFMAILAAFATFLHRYSGQDDIVIGTPFAGRNRGELERMIGYFINPLALRVDLSGDPSFRELLRRTRETTLNAFAHGDVPYEMVVRATTPERDLSQTPVFQVMMVLHNPEWQRGRPKFEPAGVTAREVSHQKGFSKFDLLIGTSQRMDGLNTTWEYSTELFDHATTGRMMRHFERLAEGAVAAPDRPISRLPMLLEEERRAILVDWAVAPAEYAKDAIVKDLFERWAERTPDADAVVFEGERLTFGELNRRANQLAHRLQREGVGPGTLVGVFMEKSLELVVAVLGVLKAGGAYVPLDPNYPQDRIEFMLEDAKPAVLVAENASNTVLQGFGGVTVFSAWSELEAEPDDNPPTTAGPEDLAYVIYTSGSTGRPKGAMITNGSLANAYYAYDEAYRLTAETTSHLQMASFSFDVFTGDLIRALLSGSKLVLCPLETLLDPPRLHRLMIEESVDCAEFVPAVATLLFEHVADLGTSLDFMRVLVVSSEGWRTEKYEFFKSLCGPETRLINAYGLTEATIDSTYFETDGALLPERFVPIGGPMKNSEIYILDSTLQPVPIGIPGELCIGGAGVARGYLNRPELTAEKFVPSPFDGGGTLYRTGDLARWLPDGNVEFLGRADRQIKIRGFRIEPGEVEAVLERHPAVRAAAVVAWKPGAADSRLVAYVEPRDAAELPAWTELREVLAAELPAFMVPSALIPVASFPLTPNGKVDLSALPEAEFEQHEDGAASAPPETETEKAIAAIWRELLGVDGIGVRDDFFALGGHSLLATQVITRLAKAFDVDLTIRAIFESPTVAGLSRAVEQARTNGGRSDGPALRRVERVVRPVVAP